MKKYKLHQYRLYHIQNLKVMIAVTKSTATEPRVWEFTSLNAVFYVTEEKWVLFKIFED